MPDLNSVPPSPRQLVASHRQSSQQMAPPPVPASPSLNILPSNQNAVNPNTPSTSTGATPQIPTSHPAQSQAVPSPARDSSVESGPGPLRHPRPLTASELHVELEKEQEAVVNRLTRELSVLRTAHNASVASNTSSTSGTTSNHEPISEPSLLSGSGFTIPTSRRHRRTSSSTSQGFSNHMSSSYDARANTGRPPRPISTSRQDNAASRRSRAGSPIPQSSLDPSSYFQQQRIPPPSSVPMSGSSATPQSGGLGLSDQLSPGMMPATTRYEETQHFKNELEVAKKENETLKRRIRELERKVQERRASDASRPRSESVSTTASMSVAPSGGANIAGPRECAVSRAESDRRATMQSVSSVGVGIPEDEVMVGESAASSGLNNNAQGEPAS